MLAFTLRPLNCKSFFLVARNDWNLSNLKNSYHVAKTMNFNKTYRPFVCQGFDFILKWFQITRSRKKYKKSGQFEQKTPPFFVSSGERKNHCHLVCRTVMKTREFQRILKSTISRKWGGGVGDWLPSLELWYSMHKWVWAVATNPCCWTWSYCAAGTRATLKKKQYSSVKMSRQPAILPLSVKYLPPTQDLGLKPHKFTPLPHSPLLLLWNILTGLKSRWFV